MDKWTDEQIKTFNIVSSYVDDDELTESLINLVDNGYDIKYLYKAFFRNRKRRIEAEAMYTGRASERAVP